MSTYKGEGSHWGEGALWSSDTPMPREAASTTVLKDYPTLSTVELAERYNVVSANDGVLVVTERAGMQFAAKTDMNAKQTPVPQDFRELGGNGSSNYVTLGRLEYNQQLDSLQGLQIYDKMRRSDGQIEAILRLAKTPILAARWFVAPYKSDQKGPGEPVDPINQEAADFVRDCLFKLMSTSFPQLMTEALLHLDFGYYMFEKVFNYKMWRGQQKIVWQKLAPRHPMDVYRWWYDDTGGPNYVDMIDTKGSGQNVPIPIEKLLVFTHAKEAGNMTGRSILRPVYKHYFYKENLIKIDAIQKERHGVGIPLIKLPPNFDSKDITLAEEMGRNLRTNEKAHIILPPLWEVSMVKLEGHQVDSLASAKYHDLLIARTILGQFLDPESATRSITDQIDMFMKSARFVAEAMRDSINKFAIQQLVDYNYPDVEGYPELRVRRIGDTTDWRTVSFAIRNFVGAGVLIPDDTMETWIRDEMDLPDADKATQRIIVAPQVAGTIPDGNPDGRPGNGGPAADAAHQNSGVGSAAQAPTAPNAGGPRQSTAANSTQGKGPGRQLPPKS